MNNLTKTIASVAGLSLLAFTPAYAGGSGGGGGGGFSGGNSGNLPQAQYDPVQDYQAGIEAIKSNDFKRADKMFKRVLGGTTRNAQANYFMGVTKVGLGKDKKATRYFKRAAKYQKNFYEAEAGLGAAYAASDQAEKAQATLASLQASAAQCGDCRDSGRITKAISKVEAAMAGNTVTDTSFLSPLGPDAIDTQYFASVALINQGKYAQAFDDLYLAAAAAGPHPDITTYMGYTQRKMGNYDTAKTYYAMALEVAPNHKGANEYLGELYVETGEMDKAYAQLAKLESICSFGCIEENELRSWIIDAQP